MKTKTLKLSRAALALLDAAVCGARSGNHADEIACLRDRSREKAAASLVAAGLGCIRDNGYGCEQFVANAEGFAHYDAVESTVTARLDIVDTLPALCR
jgi:hypothetical protein